MVRPFRFAASTHGVGSAPAWRALARQVEALGYDTLQISDHIADGLAPVPALAVAAEVTTTLRVGTLVLANDLRNPVVAAKELATLDLLSEGRLEWGMGAGWVEADYEATGIDMAPGRTRVARLGAAVTVMKRCFADGEPTPVQHPHPPLLIGGAERGILALAAREADTVGIGPSLLARAILGAPPTCTPAEAVDRQVAWLHAAAPERVDEQERHVVAFPVIVTDDAHGQAERFGHAYGWSAAEVLESPHVLIGSVAAMCDAIEARRARWGISAITVPATAAEVFARVVERLSGR